ncbi:hypothetical protein CEXT_650521 [Caerostris extrusa]|uniref:Uncharacterized protein n=1 Tax=Caerostris extrusa TaxID=172846 RepID=A0AAV4MVK9_CAEEX|nr:hypothetical protein CEXT_650521 [Caerostris extrusa]
MSNKVLILPSRIAFQTGCHTENCKVKFIVWIILLSLQFLMCNKVLITPIPLMFCAVCHTENCEVKFNIWIIFLSLRCSQPAKLGPPFCTNV